MTKLLFIFTIYLLSVMNSCVREGEGVRFSYYWRSFEIELIANIPDDATEIVIEKDRLGLWILWGNIYLIRENTGGGAIHNFTPFTRINSITSIEIKTLYDYSDVYPAGTDIAHLFQGAVWWGITPKLIPIDRVIMEFNARNVHSGEIQERFPLFLHDNTGQGGRQRLKITISFDNGVVLVQETEDFVLV